MFYVKERYLRVHEFGTSRDVPTLSLRRAGHSQGGLGSGPRSLEYNAMNPAECNLLLFSDHDGGTFELLAFSEDTTTSSQTEHTDSKRGLALSAVFLARNRFAILDKNRQVTLITKFTCMMLLFADNYQGPQQRETQECCPSKSQHRLHVFCWDFWSTSFTIG
jgi:hypothetical protein